MGHTLWEHSCRWSTAGLRKHGVLRTRGFSRQRLPTSRRPNIPQVVIVILIMIIIMMSRSGSGGRSSSCSRNRRRRTAYSKNSGSRKSCSKRAVGRPWVIINITLMDSLNLLFSAGTILIPPRNHSAPATGCFQELGTPMIEPIYLNP